MKHSSGTSPRVLFIKLDKVSSLRGIETSSTLLPVNFDKSCKLDKVSSLRGIETSS